VGERAKLVDMVGAALILGGFALLLLLVAVLTW
jgi:hypothetical protein